MPIRALALGVAAAALAGLTGCSSAQHPTATSTTTQGETLTTTVSPQRLAIIGAQHVKDVRAVLADERKYCGGADRLQPSSAAFAARCARALAGLSRAAREFARAVVFLRAPSDLEPLVADTIDAARPVIDLVRSYTRLACLSSGAHTTRCDSARRDLAAVIAAFEQVLGRWKTEAGAA